MSEPIAAAAADAAAAAVSTGAPAACLGFVVGRFPFESLQLLKCGQPGAPPLLRPVRTVKTATIDAQCNQRQLCSPKANCAGL